MGQEESTMEPVGDPIRLRNRTLKATAEFIKSEECQRVAFMVGAGISTAAGIPDFRSPSTGLYASLARLNLSHPEDVFDITFFRENPLPFYTLASELWPGKFAPTLTHHFISLFHRKNLLKRVFTQNIDTLELAAGIPEDLVTFAHGSFQTQSCIDCHEPFPRDAMEQAVLEAKPAFCGQCGGLVKPDITFFGEALPTSFFDTKDDVEAIDLAIIIGSSLSVYPFATLPQLVDEKVPRLLINMEQVGGIGGRREDVVWLGECDDAVMELAKELGWWEELEKDWLKTRRPEYGDVKQEGGRREERLESEVERLTREVEKSLEVAKGHEVWVKNQLAKDEIKRTERNEANEANEATKAAGSEKNDEKNPVEKTCAGFDNLGEGEDLPPTNPVTTTTEESKPSSAFCTEKREDDESSVVALKEAALTKETQPKKGPEDQQKEVASITGEITTKNPTITTLEDLTGKTEKLGLGL